MFDLIKNHMNCERWIVLFLTIIGFFELFVLGRIETSTWILIVGFIGYDKMNTIIRLLKEKDTPKQ